jgi:hypothetical protein
VIWSGISSAAANTITIGFNPRDPLPRDTTKKPRHDVRVFNWRESIISSEAEIYRQ